MAAGRTLDVTGLVLRRRERGESDRLLTVLTEERGKLEAVAKGARKVGSRLAGSSEPGTVARFLLVATRRTWYVTQVEPLVSFPGLRTDWERLALALAWLELLDVASPLDRPDPGLFELAVFACRALADHPFPDAVLVWAACRFLLEEGQLPRWTECVAGGGRLAENPAWVSPSAGGYVAGAASTAFPDRFRASAEALIGLARISELEAPPPRLKRAREALSVLLRFLEHSAHAPLRAWRSALEEMPLPAYSSENRPPESGA